MLENLIDEVNSSELSSIIQVVMKLITVINDPLSSAKDLKEVIEKDPPLTAKLLKLSNTAKFGFAREIKDIQEAVVAVGYEALKELALSQKVCELFKNEDLIHGYKRVELWKHSFACAYFCKLVSRREFTERGESLYVIALLHNLGISILDQFRHGDFQEILSVYKAGDQNLVEIEDERLGFDHAVFSQKLFENWELPSMITEPIGRHHDPLKEEDDNMRNAVLLFLGDYFCQYHDIGFADNNFTDLDLVYECLDKYKLRESAMNLVMDEVKEEIKTLEGAGFF